MSTNVTLLPNTKRESRVAGDHISIEELHALRHRLTAPSIDQAHLFEGWPQNPEYYSAEQIDLLEDLLDFSDDYEGGVEQYIVNGRRLLDLRDQESDIFSGLEMPPLIFKAPSLYEKSDELMELEKSAAKLLKKTVFVLVAGGMGERLGYSGAKVGLPVETATGKMYLDHYMRWAVEVGGPKVPFVIMTSDETHQNTLQLIQELGFEKMENLVVLKQEAVFCFSDAAAHLAVSKGKLIRKPHGHGDVHSLIYRAVDDEGVPIVDHWVENDYEYIAFFQDTNILATTTIPIQIAMSEKHDLNMNFSCIPRLPKEAIGALCRVRKDDGKGWKTVNVEYNIFEEVARNLTREGGDYAEATAYGEKKYSPYPGSINNLVMDLPTYRKLLKEHKGIVPEFMNPKYTDATRRKFAKPARIESLMQDFAFFYSEEHRVGTSLFDRFSYQPVKNSLQEAKKKVEQGISPFCAATGEADYYEFFRRRLNAVGVFLSPEPRTDIVVADFLPTQIFPIIVIDSSAARGGMLKELAEIFPSPDLIHISEESTLIITGKVVIQKLRLDGALRICGPPTLKHGPLVVKNLSIRTATWKVTAVPPDHPNEIECMRGFKLEKVSLTEFDPEGDLHETSKL